MKVICRIIFALFLGTFSSLSFASATNDHVWYAAASAGIFQGLFNTQFNDQTDMIPNNFRQPVTQNSYTGALAVGYSQTCGNGYFCGGELSLGGATYHANFGAGAASAAFTNTIGINGNLDLAFIPGFLVTETIALYGKAGLSYACITSDVNSPTGFTPVFVNVSSTQRALGAVLGVGIEKILSQHSTLFLEYAYHDYGTVDFSPFSNFTATYSNSAHVYSNSLSLGLTYLFK